MQHVSRHGAMVRASDHLAMQMCMMGCQCLKQKYCSDNFTLTPLSASRQATAASRSCVCSVLMPDLPRPLKSIIKWLVSHLRDDTYASWIPSSVKQSP